MNRARQLKEMAKFNIGKNVSFQHNGRKVVGRIIRLNQKSISILTENNEKWNVVPTLLQEVEESEESINEQNEVEVEQGKVVSFEPNPIARNYLIEHLALNGISNVIIEDIALSDDEGEKDFYLQKGAVTWNSTLIERFLEEKETEKISVPTTTLDNYVKQKKLIPKVIKIDTEGSELLII